MGEKEGYVDGDGNLDAILARNFLSPQRETGRMDGGLGLNLENDGKGNLTPMSSTKSGLEIPGDAKSLTLSDLNGDNQPDLVFGVNDTPIVSYLSQEIKKQVVFKLPANSFGTKISFSGTLKELSGGGSYPS